MSGRTRADDERFPRRAEQGLVQCEELVADRPEPEVRGVEFVDRFVQTLDRGIHARNPTRTYVRIASPEGRKTLKK